jgi:hypothetical protein
MTTIAGSPKIPAQSRLSLSHSVAPQAGPESHATLAKGLTSPGIEHQTEDHVTTTLPSRGQPFQSALYHGTELNPNTTTYRHLLSSDSQPHDGTPSPFPPPSPPPDPNPFPLPIPPPSPGPDPDPLPPSSWKGAYNL